MALISNLILAIFFAYFFDVLIFSTGVSAEVRSEVVEVLESIPDPKPLDIKRVIEINYGSIHDCPIRSAQMLYESSEGEHKILDYRVANFTCGG